MKSIFWENIIKNAVLVFLLLFAYSEIESFVFSPNFTSDPTEIGSLLIVVSILAVTACFGNYAFSYEKMSQRKLTTRMLGHLTTGLLMLLIGLSLEMTAVLAQVLIGSFYVLNLSFIILYIASVLYDFWDLKRVDL